MKIYAGTYGKYNDGSIAGEWLEVTGDYDLLIQQIKELHDDEPDFELMIQDYDFESDAEAEIFNDLGECPDLEQLCADVEALEGKNLEMIAAYIYCFGRNGESIETISEKAYEAYCGTYSSDADFAEDVAEQTCEMPAHLSWPFNCIDWEQAARDLMFDYSTHNDFYFTNF